MAKTESEKNKFLNKVKQQCSNKQAQENIYLTLFGASNANKKEGSFFLSDEQFISKPLTYPEAEQVKVWDNGKCSKILQSSLESFHVKPLVKESVLY